MIKLTAWAVFQIGPHDPRDWRDWRIIQNPVHRSFSTFVRPYRQCNHPACSTLRAKLPGSNLFSQDCLGKGLDALSCSFYLSIALPLYIPTFLSVDLSQLHVGMISLRGSYIGFKILRGYVQMLNAKEGWNTRTQPRAAVGAKF